MHLGRANLARQDGICRHPVVNVNMEFTHVWRGSAYSFANTGGEGSYFRVIRCATPNQETTMADMACPFTDEPRSPRSRGRRVNLRPIRKDRLGCGVAQNVAESRKENFIFPVTKRHCILLWGVGITS